jgi:hypothetical protein
VLIEVVQVAVVIVISRGCAIQTVISAQRRGMMEKQLLSVRHSAVAASSALQWKKKQLWS